MLLITKLVWFKKAWWSRKDNRFPSDSLMHFSFDNHAWICANFFSFWSQVICILLHFRCFPECDFSKWYKIYFLLICLSPPWLKNTRCTLGSRYDGHGDWTISQPWPESTKGEGGQAEMSGLIACETFASLRLPYTLGFLHYLRAVNIVAFHTAWCKRLKKPFCWSVAHYCCT